MISPLSPFKSGDGPTSESHSKMFLKGFNVLALQERRWFMAGSCESWEGGWVMVSVVCWKIMQTDSETDKRNKRRQERRLMQCEVCQWGSCLAVRVGTAGRLANCLAEWMNEWMNERDGGMVFRQMWLWLFPRSCSSVVGVNGNLSSC